ncbi:MAG: hypothetical protein IIB38_17015 [Candidatus Hydrogenedentes bacterium]|nr:hypothetical protein [Candidatus Hydrogenedentota bacterium]
MTNEELLEWGKNEASLRKKELQGVNSEAGLKRVQTAVAGRRKAAGITRSDATYAVMAA